MHRLLSLIVVAGLFSALPGLASAQPEAADRPLFSVTELAPTASYASVAPRGLSDAGVVVGLQSTMAGTTQAASWDGSAWHLLGSGEADAINSKNFAVGFRNVDSSAHATEWNGQGTPLDLGLLPNGRWSQALAINDRAWVAGYAQTNGSSTHAFLWRQAQGMRDLGTLGSGNSYGFGLNQNGEVVGSASGVAVLWDSHQQIHDLGAGTGSVAYGINDSGVVVGVAGTHAFTWTSAHGLRTLPSAAGATSSTATSIDKYGVIVGSDTVKDASGNLSSRATAWYQDRVVDLNSLIDPSSGWQLTSASAINDHFEIVGAGVLNGQPRGFLLKLAAPLNLRSIAEAD